MQIGTITYTYTMKWDNNIYIYEVVCTYNHEAYISTAIYSTLQYTLTLGTSTALQLFAQNGFKPRSQSHGHPGRP